MKIKVHIGLLIFGAFLLILITYFGTEKYNEPTKPVTIKKKKDYDIVTFKLPNTIDADIFGPEYWRAFHTLADMIPCAICRNDAVPMFRFVHDLVNKKLKKKLQYPENYDKWIERICKKEEVKEEITEAQTNFNS